MGDVCRALGDDVAQYCDGFMNALYENLRNPTVSRSVKIAVLSCFGDIAMAIGGAFEPYLDATMSVLQQAGALAADSVSVFTLLRCHYIKRNLEGGLRSR